MLVIHRKIYRGRLELAILKISFSGNSKICSGEVAGVLYTLVQHVPDTAFVGIEGENATRLAIDIRPLHHAANLV